MKQKLFENIGGNTFKLITESVSDENPKAKLVREGLKKVFGAGDKKLSYKRLQGVGFGYIKSVEEAKNTAIQEARILAKEYGYMDNENDQSFVKEAEPMYGAEEKREVQIGKAMLHAVQTLKSSLSTSGSNPDAADELQNLEVYARELIHMHGQK
jgi:hypothetical protein